MLDAAAASFGIAAASAAAALCSHVCGAALTHSAVPRPRRVLAMIYRPVAEVITGISLLRVSSPPDVGRFVTVAAAHATLYVLRHVVVQSRLATFDRSLEEAAMDLGCPPAHLPHRRCADRTRDRRRLPAGVLASLDDLVIASFTTSRAPTRCRCGSIRR